MEIIRPAPQLRSCLHIREAAYAKIMHWVRLSPVEISGLGMVEIIDGIPTVTEVCLCKQKNSATSTDIDGADIGKAMFEFDRRQVPGEMRFWWHSHVDMEAFWSGTDLSTIEQLGSRGWFISTVFNKRADQRTAFYSQEPFRWFVDQVPTEVIVTRTAEMDQWDAEYKAKCEERTYGYGPKVWHEEREGSQLILPGGTHRTAKREEEDALADEIAELRAKGWPEHEIRQYMGFEEYQG